MRIAIITDAWHPQVNGVVRTLDTTRQWLARRGHDVRVITPDGFRTVPCPTYPSIRLAVLPGAKVRAALDAFVPEAIHIATEGPLGQAAHRYCARRGLPFTTSFHTQFPEYLRLRAPVPVAWTYAWLRRFHARAARTLVPTPTQLAKLEARGFANLRLWSRGVDTDIFNPHEAVVYDWPRPIVVYMGRVAIEKNIEAFLEASIPGTKLVIGDGPDLERLRARHPECRFLGAKSGRDLARHVAGGDVFVFPSRTDTFGLVLLEAMACGLPVAAYPVQGPLDVVADGVTGCLGENLATAIARALSMRPSDCIEHAARYTWAACTAAFEGHLAPIVRRVPMGTTSAASAE
ncbi:MAG: glycosyltransferase family 1 protein [Gammaproteobacteria bacterium]|nr:glycosyltransferase family 1 protein [Gammaproteobacteria bacterium]